MLQNLRRTASAFALTFMVLTGWTLTRPDAAPADSAADGYAAATDPRASASPAVPDEPARRWDHPASKGPNTSEYVVLTYDDCPGSRAAFEEAVLAAEEQGIALALFPVGTCVAAGRFDADFARAHGQYVFNHSATHKDLTKLPHERILVELSAPGIETNWGRPPFGAVNDAVTLAYAEKGMGVWLWNIDTRDWDGRSQADVVAHTVRNARAGDTILMHMSKAAFNPVAFSEMRAGLVERGLAVCRNHGPTVQWPELDC